MTQIRLRGPADVVAVLPYQLGYHPQDSIVVVALHDRAVGLIERLDLPAPEDAEEAGRVLVGPLLRERPEAVLLVGYETAEGSSEPALDAVRGQLLEADLDVLDRLVVRDGRWYAIDCADPCCPPAGTPVQAADSPAVAEYVGLEVAPLTGRSELSALVAADPALTAAVGAALGELGAPASDLTATGLTATGLSDAAHRLRALSGWAVVCDVTAGAAEVEALDPAQIALLVHSLEDLALRDGLVAWLCPGALPFDCLPPDLLDALRCTLPTPSWHRAAPDGSAAIAGRRLVARLQSLVRAVPDEHSTPALTVLANLAWWQGDGALARTCLDRALEALPDYRLALLLERMLDLGVRPGGHGDELAEGVRAG